MNSRTLLGIDVGAVRIGVALVRTDVRIAQPLTTLPNGDNTYATIAALVAQHAVSTIVVGWPRNLEGQATAQTAYVERFVEALRPHVTQPIELQDEALTSHQAEAELASRKKPYDKGDIDALAATYILQDYIEQAARV